jgi:hypothetical protein
LKEEILTRKKNKAKFESNEIFYVLFTIANAWDEWKKFCGKFGFDDHFFAISSEHILLNPDGDLQLITPVSSPLDMPSLAYYGN